MRHRECLVARGPTDREGNDLHRRDHLAGDHRREGRKRRKRDVLVDLVEAADAVAIDDDDTRAVREQVGAAGEGPIDLHAGAGHRRGEHGGGGVFRDVVRLEPRHRDRADAGRAQRGDLGVADHRALAQHERTFAERMDHDAALRLGGWHRSELHFTFSADFSAA